LLRMLPDSNGFLFGEGEERGTHNRENYIERGRDDGVRRAGA